jgi:hypothetical protein
VQKVPAGVSRELDQTINRYAVAGMEVTMTRRRFEQTRDYRAFILGHDGHVQSRVDLLCDDEAEAIRLAKQLVDGHDVELWQLDPGPRKDALLKKIGQLETTANMSEWLRSPGLQPPR